MKKNLIGILVGMSLLTNFVNAETLNKDENYISVRLMKYDNTEKHEMNYDFIKKIDQKAKIVNVNQFLDEEKVNFVSNSKTIHPYVDKAVLVKDGDKENIKLNNSEYENAFYMTVNKNKEFYDINMKISIGNTTFYKPDDKNFGIDLLTMKNYNFNHKFVLNKDKEIIDSWKGDKDEFYYVVIEKTTI